MSDNAINRQKSTDPESNRIAGREDVETPKAGKVSVDRYLEALRKGVMLSQ